MIPKWIDRAATAPGELDMFDLLQAAPGTDDWTVLHSLDLPMHIRQVQGEIDFLVLIPGGAVIVLEVKSHRSARRDQEGIWYLGRDRPTVRSPFKQAAEAMHSLRRRLNDRELSDVPYVSAVAFPHTSFTCPPTEWHPWQVFDQSDIVSIGVDGSLRRVASGARSHFSKSRGAKWFEPQKHKPTLMQCKAIAKRLRPEFESHRSPKDRRDLRDRNLKIYTDEQFDILDQIEHEPRILLTGAAGTGKTLLAIEAARRSAAAGKQTLICCYNQMLGAWIRQEVANEPLITARTLHAVITEIVGKRPIGVEGADSTFWNAVTEEAAERLLFGDDWTARFESLIVDEAQDLSHPENLDILDLITDGGLTEGRLVAFGDFERQSIYGYGDNPRSILEARVPGLRESKLRVNCRNLPRIGSIIGQVGGVEYSRFRRLDDGVVNPKAAVYTTDPDTALIRHLNELCAEGYALDDIVVLSPRAVGAAASVFAHRPDLLCEAKRPVAGRARFCTVHAFKGLESPAVIVVDVDAIGNDRSLSLLYTAISRATDRLVVLAHDSVAQELAELAQGGRT